MTAAAAEPASAGPRQRIDKWLWYARLAKTRTAAQKLAVSGKVRVNREKVDAASHLVRPGDVLTVALPGGVRVLRILDGGTRRGPAGEAMRLYEDLSPPTPARTAAPGERPAPAAGAGKPGKRDRRALAAMKSAAAFDPDFSGDGDS